MKLALFDLDNTLLGGDSDHAWGEFLITEGLVDEAVHREQNDAFYRQYQQGTLDIRAYVEFAAAPIAGLSPQRLRELHQRFMQHHITPMLLPRSSALLASHRKAGDYCLIITATNRLITAPIASLMQVDGLIATELESVDGVYTGRMAGVPSFQQGKVARLHQWLEEHNAIAGNPRLGLEDSIFYSDSFNDLPLLELVGEAVAVDPDPTLRDMASERGWRTISLRSD